MPQGDFQLLSYYFLKSVTLGSRRQGEATEDQMLHNKPVNTQSKEPTTKLACPNLLNIEEHFHGGRRRDARQLLIRGNLQCKDGACCARADCRHIDAPPLSATCVRRIAVKKALQPRKTPEQGRAVTRMGKTLVV